MFDATNRMVRGVNENGDASLYTYNALFYLVNNTWVMKNGQRNSRDFVVDYTSDLLTRTLMVYAQGAYDQSHTFRGDERVLQITDRANNQERLLYVHEDIRGTTLFYTRPGGQVFEEHLLDAWGFPLSPGSLRNSERGNFITASFTGHRFDAILDMYFAQARFYDAQNRQFISRDPAKDGFNWYKYCSNNPKTYVDPTGLYFVRVKDDLIRIYDAITDTMRKTFGVGTTNVIQIHHTRIPIIPDPSPITVTQGSRHTNIQSTHGDSSKPISVFARVRNDNPVFSSVGLRINISSVSISLTLGADDIGLSGSKRDGQKTETVAIKADLSQLKIGFENSITTRRDYSIDETAFMNYSVSGWAIVAGVLFLKTGLWVPTPQH